jgi:hypothetical protein
MEVCGSESVQTLTDPGGPKTYESYGSATLVSEPYLLPKNKLISVAVLRIRVRRIHMFLGILDPDPLVRGSDPDPAPSIIMQK